MIQSSIHSPFAGPGRPGSVRNLARSSRVSLVPWGISLKAGPRPVACASCETAARRPLKGRTKRPRSSSRYLSTRLGSFLGEMATQRVSVSSGSGSSVTTVSAQHCQSSSGCLRFVERAVPIIVRPRRLQIRVASVISSDTAPISSILPPGTSRQKSSMKRTRVSEGICGWSSISWSALNAPSLSTGGRVGLEISAAIPDSKPTRFRVRRTESCESLRLSKQYGLG